MTSKLNRQKQKTRAYRVEFQNQRRLLKAARRELVSSCGHCDFDEAEGELMNHCAACKTRIVRTLYELLVS